MRPFALDLDGTLIGCRERQVAVARALVGDLDAERFWTAKRAGATTRDALAAQGLPDPDVAAAAWAERIEDESFLALDLLAPTAREAVEEVRRAQLAPFLLTARRNASAVQRQVRRLGLLQLVEEVCVVDPLNAVQEKAECLRARGAAGFVGDTESDAHAARLAGVAFAAVACGQRDEQFLRESGVAEIHPDVLAAVRALVGPRG